MTRPNSILEGIDTLVDEWLGIAPIGKAPHYQYKTAAQELSRRETPITGTAAFLNNCYNLIHANWRATKDDYSKPSSKNWRWEKRTKIGDNNKSKEVNLERAIVRECGNNWANQMPTASGLIGPATHRHNAVDLVYRQGPTTYSLIELKVDSNTPLYAAVEILKHGLLFVWSKKNRKELGYDPATQPLLAATNLTLSVLAPSDYYRGYKLSDLNRALNEGLEHFGYENNLTLWFEFSRLGDSYSEDACPAQIRLAINERHKVC